MAPHPALTMTDIILEILEYTDVDDSDFGPRTLLSAALSCKAFLEPSLDLLWRSMDSVVPLLRLLPGLRDIDTGNGINMILVGPLDNKSSPRFFTYARRIKTLDYWVEGHPDFARIHPSTCIRLSQLKTGLLPSLRALKVFVHDLSSVSFERCLLMLPCLLRSEALQSLTLRLYPHESLSDHFMGPMSTILADINPDIRALRLSGRLPSEYAGSLQGFRGLRSLTLNLSGDSGSCEIIDALSSLEQLIELKLNMEDYVTPQITGNMSAGFPSLTKLMIAGRLSLVIRILEIPPPNVLQSVTVRRVKAERDFLAFPRSSRDLQNRQWQTCCEKIGRFVSLRDLSLDWNISMSNDDRNPSISTISIIEPLLQLKYIESLTLKSLPSSLHFSDRDIADVAAAWPKIKSLHLGHSSEPQVTRPTFAALQHLADNCPDLVKLAINVGQGNFFALTDEAQVSSHGLQQLDLQNTTINNPAIVARHLDRMFPNLVQITSRNMPENVDQLRTIVFDVCQPVRKDQVKRGRVVS